MKTTKSILIVAIFVIAGLGKSLSYEKIVYPQGNTEEIVDLVFEELKQKRSLKLALSPRDISLREFYLVPDENYLQSVYRFEIKYPLKSIWHQSFLEYNLRFLLADQTNALIELQEELQKRRELEEKARQILGKYYSELFGQSQNKGEIPLNLEEGIDFSKILTISEKGPKEASIIPSSHTTTPQYTEYFGELRKKERLEQKQKKNNNLNTETGESKDGILKKMVSATFAIINWLENNKEIFLVLYLFILLGWIVISGGRK